MCSGKVMIIDLIPGYTKMISLYKISYFSEPYNHSKNQIKVELDLPDYATKSDSKGATNINTRKFAKEAYLGDLKSDVDLRC